MSRMHPPRPSATSWTPWFSRQGLFSCMGSWRRRSVPLRSSSTCCLFYLGFERGGDVLSFRTSRSLFSTRDLGVVDLFLLPPRPLNSFLLLLVSTWDLGVVGPFFLPPRPLNSFLLLLGWLRFAVSYDIISFIPRRLAAARSPLPPSCQTRPSIL